MEWPEAVVLGLAHGPAELLPISSSAHVTLIPWLAGWSYADEEAEWRKTFEVALHAGTVAAMLLAGPVVVDPIGAIGLACIAPAVAGFALERQIERLGTPATIAGGLVAGAVAMAVSQPGGRRRAEAGPVDGLVLGLAQACALWPGVSRNGATLAAARARGFTAGDAQALSRACGLPITLGAVGLRLARSARRASADHSNAAGPGGDRGAGVRLDRLMLGGGLAAFASTLAVGRLVGRVERERSLVPYAAYRIGLAGVVVGRLRKNQADGRRPGREADRRRAQREADERRVRRGRR